jgi:beta-glucosidase
VKKALAKCLILLVGFFQLFYIQGAFGGYQENSSEKLDLPSQFLWGTAVSEFQVSGAENCPNAQWANWESKGSPYIKTGDRTGKSADHWNRYREDIQIMKDMGVNSFRFSIEWSAIEPEEGVINEAALDHYMDVFDALDEAQITPMVTLYHFTHPKWFEDLGAFEKEKNIEYFTRFCKLIFQRFGDRAPLWCTMNEPSVIVLEGYMLGEFPPGKKDYALAGEVYRNLLFAHCMVYEALKAMPGGKEAQIGIVHAYLKLKPYHTWNLIESYPCYYMNENLNNAMMRFLKTGVFNFYFPFMVDISTQFVGAQEMYDFIGLNYYSSPLITLQFSFSDPLVSTCFEGEMMTDMPYRSYPKGFYDALVDCNSLRKPIYVTENGIADARDDRRSDFIGSYLSAMNQAVRDGCDVRGYFYWSFIDNFEWAEGWKMRFGLYEFDPVTKERKLKEGAKTYQNKIREAKQLSYAPRD